MRRSLADRKLLVEDDYHVKFVRDVITTPSGKAVRFFADPGGHRTILLADIVQAR